MVHTVIPLLTFRMALSTPVESMFMGKLLLAVALMVIITIRIVSIIPMDHGTYLGTFLTKNVDMVSIIR